MFLRFFIFLIGASITIGNACAPPPPKNMGICKGSFTKDDSSNEMYAFWDYGFLGAGSTPDPSVKNWYFIRGHCDPGTANK